MEHLIDRSIFFGLGVLVGLFMNTIVSLLRDIKEKVTEVDEIVKNDHDPRHVKNEDGFFKLGRWGTAIYMLIIVLLVAYSAVITQLNANKQQDRQDQVAQQAYDDKVSRCNAGVDNRNVQRALVEAIYGLATSVVEQPKGSPPLTRSKAQRTNEYIAKVNAFRADTYAQIKPSEECAPFVDDDNVVPPTDPFPNIPVPKERR